MTSVFLSSGTRTRLTDNTCLRISMAWAMCPGLTSSIISLSPVQGSSGRNKSSIVRPSASTHLNAPCRSGTGDGIVAPTRWSCPTLSQPEGYANPLLGKRHSLDREAFAPVVDEFYTLHGWDAERGWPTAAGLCELGLQDVYDPMIEGAAAQSRAKAPPTDGRALGGDAD